MLYPEKNRCHITPLCPHKKRPLSPVPCGRCGDVRLYHTNLKNDREYNYVDALVSSSRTEISVISDYVLIQLMINKVESLGQPVTTTCCSRPCALYCLS